MSITRAQIARQLLAQGGSPGNRTRQRVLPRADGRRPGYYGSDAGFGDGGYKDESSKFGSGSGSGGSDQDFARARSAMAARSAAEAKAKEELKKQKAIENFAKEQGKKGINVSKTFKKGTAATKKPPPQFIDEDKDKLYMGDGKGLKEIKEKSYLDKGIDFAKDQAKNYAKQTAIGAGLTTLGIANPVGLTAMALGKMFSGPKGRRDAQDFGLTDKQARDARNVSFDDPNLGDDNFPLIQPPSVIQPNRQEVIEEEPTPYDFDLYAARDNRVGSRFAQGGRTGFNMGGMEEENLQAGAPDLRLEGNQVPQQEEMASAPGIDAELYQLFMDALRKGEVPPGTTFDAYKQLMMQMMSEQQGGQMQEEMQPEMQEGIMQAQMMEPEREMAAFGGIMGSDGRRAYGFGSFFKKAKRAVKKVLKSDLGKAALIGLAGAGLGSFTKSAAAAGTNKSFSRFNPKNLAYLTGYKGKDYKADLLKAADEKNKKLGLDFAKQLPKLSANATDANRIKLFELQQDFAKDQIAKQAVKPESFFGSDLSKTIASIGIPAAMGLVYSKGKADEKPMDQNTLARIEGYNNPLFQDGIAGARARIQAGDNTGFNFRGPDSIYAAEGGRIGYQDAGPVQPKINRGQVEMLIKKGADNELIKTYVDGVMDNDINQIRNEVQDIMRNNKAEGGLMNLGGNEMDLRGGGFVPLGAKEKADDVPARLSKNEFVFTADAVRAAGGGSVDKGAEKMYNTMKRLEGVMA